MSLLRRGPAPSGGPEEGPDYPGGADDALEVSRPPREGGRAASGSTQAGRTPQTDREAKSAQRARRMDLVRQARKATSAMEPPEPLRGIYVSAYLVVIGVFSYMSTDVGQTYVKVKGKTETVTQTLPPHPATAAILVVLALAAGATIYWRRRYVTGIAFMLTAAIGMGVPFPNGLKDLAYLTFVVPALYVLWMLMFRMNKQQKAWLATHSPAASRGGQSRSSGRPQADRKQATTARSRRAREEPVVTASGRALPPNSGRYTQPRAKPRAGARKS